ncbi:MAG: hypothetical protein Q9217_004233 [Psora testacea]
MIERQIQELRQEAEHMFYHGYDNYMKHAFPEDELRPISCSPLTRDQKNVGHIELNDALGNYSLTLIDSLSTLAIMASSSSSGMLKKNKALLAFQSGVAALVEQYGDGTSGTTGVGKRAKGFDLDSKVQVFETVIRGVGGLLSAHLFAVGELPIRGYNPKGRKNNKSGSQTSIKWPNKFVYNGQLLRLAENLARRLLPAFFTPTGLPYPRVNLRHGVPFYANSPLNHNAETGQCPRTHKPSAELTETCSAGAGSLVLEFTTLSRLTGDPVFEQVGKRAFWSVWERKSSIGLVGSGIDAESGRWTTPYTGIGAGIDSFYEYAAKSSVLLAGSPVPAGLPPMPINGTQASKPTQLVPEEQQTADAFYQVWQASHASIKRHLYRGDQYMHPHYIQGDLYTGASRAFWIDSLSAFFPGLLAFFGKLEESIETHLLFTALWTRYSAIPERWSTSSGGVESGLGWWGGRPEFIESTYYLYQATKDPWYLHVGEMVLRDIKRRCWAKCGWSGIQDVRNGDKSDRMESFFLGETAKYLFLLFDPEHPLNKLDAAFVYNTEGHPLIIPRHSPASHRCSKRKTSVVKLPKDKHRDLSSTMCPPPPTTAPLTISVTAARKDVFHAASLARLHMMPTRDNLDSPLAEYTNDHPSITLSDVRSPSNYTYYPWTLPLELVPRNGISSKISTRHTFDITFPATPNTLLGPGVLQRVGNGILVNSMSGLRFGMIQDVTSDLASDVNVDHYRVQAINNIVLGKDEQIFIAKDTASNIVNPLDPNFTRIRDPALLELVIDLAPVKGKQPTEASADVSSNTTTMPLTHTPSIVLDDSNTSNREAASSVRQAFSMLLQQVGLLMSDPPISSPNSTSLFREYFPAVLPLGPGAAPLPDVEDARAPDAHGNPRGSLIWHSVYIADDGCGKMSSWIPREHQVIVMKRGGCSFTQKLQNIPTIAPSKSSLQLVVIVSYEEGEGIDGVSRSILVRPLLESAQMTPSGLPRRHPIPMVMLGGGDETYALMQRAVKMGVKRRYEIRAQGVPISNLIIL